MTNRKYKLESIARVYLNLRGFQIREQNWSYGRHKIDLIAKKNDYLYFIFLFQNQIVDPTESILNFRSQSINSYIKQNKWLGRYETAELVIAVPGYQVISFSSNIK